MTTKVSGRGMVQARSLRELSQGIDRPEYQKDYLCEYLNHQELSGAMLKEVSDNELRVKISRKEGKGPGICCQEVGALGKDRNKETSWWQALWHAVQCRCLFLGGGSKNNLELATRSKSFASCLHYSSSFVSPRVYPSSQILQQYVDIASWLSLLPNFFPCCVHLVFWGSNAQA